MPFTPFHFGPWSAAGLLLRRRIDLPVFLFANVAIDLEPFAALILRWSIPVHGPFHSFTVGGALGALWGLFAWHVMRKPFAGMMRTLGLAYEAGRTRMIVSGILGFWSHVLLDATLYPEINLFFPVSGNFLYGLVREPAMYRACALAFAPAIAIFLWARHADAKRAAR